ncbi:unnamed protein product [Linum trigynum]|uniref:Uncharacterized protein n=1 Tax=Linum trigynum TaxID=586398 RepID=A0AAV2F690_9ROSI
MVFFSVEEGVWAELLGSERGIVGGRIYHYAWHPCILRPSSSATGISPPVRDLFIVSGTGVGSATSSLWLPSTLRVPSTERKKMKGDQFVFFNSIS